MQWIRGSLAGLPEALTRLFNSGKRMTQDLGAVGIGSHPPGGEGGLLAALDVDRAEFLHAAQASGRQVGVGQVCGLLTAPGAAGGGEAGVAGERRASGGRVVLHRALHAVLLKHLLVDKLVVLREDGEDVKKKGGGGAPVPV